MKFSECAFIVLSSSLINEFRRASLLALKESKAEVLKESISDPEKLKAVLEIDNPVWKILSKTKERRFIKTHQAFSLLPPNLTKAGCKIIYVARNPKDVVVSAYHLSKSLRIVGYTVDFAKYLTYFQRDLVIYAPYWEHIKEGWNMRHEENVLFLFYEDMNKNLRPTIVKLASFLGKTYSDEELNRLEEHFKFENFQKNKSVNLVDIANITIGTKTEDFFIRKGKNGGWRDYFDDDMEKIANKWIEENLKDTDLRFPI